MLSITESSFYPLFPFEQLQSVGARELKSNNPEDKYISTKFIELIIANCYGLKPPFQISSFEECAVDSYEVYILNSQYIIFISEYKSCTIDYDYIEEIRESITQFSSKKKLLPCFVFISYENVFLNAASSFGKSTGFFLLDRKELLNFISQFSLENYHWINLQSNLTILERSTNPEKFYEVINHKQAAEGYYMHLSSILCSLGMYAHWYYDKESKNQLTLLITNPNLKECPRIVTEIINDGGLKVYVKLHSFSDCNFCCANKHETLIREKIKNLDLELTPIESKSGTEISFEIKGFNWKDSKQLISQNLIKFINII